MLLTGAAPRFLRHAASGGDGESRFSEDRLWWPPTKVVGHYLAPWLARQTDVDLTAPPRAGVDIAVELDDDRDARPLALEPLGGLPRHGRW